MGETEDAFMDLISWKQQELRRLADPRLSPVETVDGYFGLWELYRELSVMLKQTHDPAERVDLQQARDAVERDIEAAKRDPRLAAQIHAWWVTRYPPPPLKGRNR